MTILSPLLVPVSPVRTGVGLFLLLILVVTVAILALLFSKSVHKGRVIVAMLALGAFAFVVLGVVVLIFVRANSYQVVEARALAQQRAAEMQAEQQSQAMRFFVENVKQTEIGPEGYRLEHSGSAEPGYSSELFETSIVEKHDLTAAGFEPDIFASKEMAVRSVTRMVAQQYKAMMTSPEDLPRGARLSYAPNLGGQGEDRAAQVSLLTRGAARALKKVFGDNPTFDVVVLPEPTDDISLVDSPRRISVFLNVIQEPGVVHGSQNEGIVKVTIVGKAGRASQQVVFLNKPWSENFYSWRSRREPASSWVLGESEDFCPDRAQSIDQAMRSAATRLREPVAKELMRSPGNQANWLRRQADLYRWLEEEGYHQLKSHELPVDVFTQEFKRPYGSVWRSAVLVYVPSEKAAALLAAYQARYSAERQTLLQTLASAGGLLVLILAVYGFLSVATRGYYVWSVRLATVALAVAGVLCIVLCI